MARKLHQSGELLWGGWTQPERELLESLLQQVVEAAYHWDVAKGKIESPLRWDNAKNGLVYDPTGTRLQDPVSRGLTAAEERSLSRSLRALTQEKAAKGKGSSGRRGKEPPGLRTLADLTEKVVSSLLWSLWLVQLVDSGARFADRELPEAIRSLAGRLEGFEQKWKRLLGESRRFNEANLRFHIKRLFRFLESRRPKDQLREYVAIELNSRCIRRLTLVGRALAEGEAPAPEGVDRAKALAPRWRGSGCRFTSEGLEKFQRKRAR